MENLHIGSNKKYLMKGDKPFFWLGDTAWMLFTNISYDEAYTYLKNRADKGFNVIQAVLIYSVDTPEALKTVNRMCCKNTAVDTNKYWHNIDMVIKLAEELGREPNLSEIAAKMQMSEDEVQAVMKEAINAVAVDRSEAAQKEDEALENQ